jgi:hypothetical protein
VEVNAEIVESNSFIFAKNLYEIPNFFAISSKLMGETLIKLVKKNKIKIF